MDLGIEVRVVERAHADDPGAFRAGNPPGWMKRAAVEPLRWGGMFDRVLRAYTGEPSKRPALWHVGAEQLTPLLFGDAELPSRFVCIGSAGAGKTAIGARWVVRRGLLRMGGSIGVAAPVIPRMRVLWEELLRVLDPRWGAIVRRSEHTILLPTGTRIALLALKEQSERTGTPAQGWTFGDGILIDEEQDTSDEALGHLYMRGRNPAGRSYVLSTCTLKRDPVWRERKARYERSTDTVVHRMRIHASPFASEQYLEDAKARLSPAAYRMLVLAEDAAPERATYPDVSRERHVKALPQLGIKEATAEVTGARWLIGHDPGTLCDVSVILRAWKIGNRKLAWWWVWDDLTTRPGNPERHAAELAALMASYGAKPEDCIISADPYGDSETTPDVSVYREYQRHRFRIRPAAYRKPTNAATAHLAGRLGKEARIQCVCSLLLSASGETRLYWRPDEHGHPAARATFDAMELSDRDITGRAEYNRKDTHDRSHWPAALGYALSPYEMHRPELSKEHTA